MRTRRTSLVWAALLVAGAGLACSGSTTPTTTCPVGTICPQVPGTAPTVAPLLLPGATLESNSVTFYAKQGEERAGAIFFRKASGERKSLVRLKFKRNTLLTSPSGAAYAIGDSVAITMTLLEPGKILFDFQPSGIRFSRTDPAELEIEYGDATGGDVNGDGVVNDTDATLATRLAIWLQERAADPFFKLETSFNDESLREIEADVFGFTRYAIAY